MYMPLLNARYSGGNGDFEVQNKDVAIEMIHVPHKLKEHFLFEREINTYLILFKQKK